MRPALLPTLLIPALAGCAPQGAPQPTVPAAAVLTLTPNPVRVGQELRFTLRSPVSGEVALFIESPDGSVIQLLPNRQPDGQVRLNADQTQLFPSAGSTFFLRASAPTGAHTALLYVSSGPLNLSGVSDYASPSSTFATVSTQGRGSLLGAVAAKMKLLNPGVAGTLTFTVQP
ncbi:DUF4384 domain-containing protein [Deinococcus actinosclerus]|uniref:DUF4384 domain-containing protein n=1 Tax=Deinococcus actinosclerus TaxID=1768108 RepID=A0ABM5X192_9DEIO|nr:DUF4384 domain-containing protein [Deinococcus actinosclerus]ALW87486.1 hypothetical protein AUC44_00055 [Deinococcus actinosclerus]